MLVKVDRYTKTKKSLFTNLEVFCLRAKDVPIESYEGLKEMTVQSVAWEPSGDRFAIIATEGQKILVGLYRMEKDTVKELSRLSEETKKEVFRLIVCLSVLL